MIRFKCCTEEDWYPCHKCHNEAVVKLAEERAREREESKPLPARPETNDVPQKTVDCTEAGESWTEIGIIFSFATILRTVLPENQENRLEMKIYNPAFIFGVKLGYLGDE